MKGMGVWAVNSMSRDPGVGKRVTVIHPAGAPAMSWTQSEALKTPWLRSLSW